MSLNFLTQELPQAAGTPLPEFRGASHLQVLQSIMQLSGEGIIILDPVTDATAHIVDFRYAYANPYAEEIMGRTLNLGRVLQIFPEMKTSGIIEVYAETFLGSKAVELKDHYVYSGPIKGWFKSRACRTGEFLLVTFNNISAEHALAESEQRYRFLADTIPHVIWTADAAGNLDFFSRRWYEYTGLNPLTSMFNAYLEAIYPEDVALTVEARDAAIAGKTPFKVVHRIKNREGKYHWMQTHAVPFLDEKGQILKWFGTTTDIHEEMEALNQLKAIKIEVEAKNAQLQRINRDLDTFVFSASHDLTAPVANLEGLTSLLSSSMENQGDEPGRQYLTHMRQSTQRLKQTIYDLTRMIQIQQSANEAREKICFSYILEKVIQDLSPMIETMQARVQLDLQVAQIFYSPKNLLLIAYNLLNTSLQSHTGTEKPDIRISTLHSGPEVLLRLSDRGPGYKPEDIPAFFRLFQKRKPANDDREMSLFLLKRLIENTGGRILVKSAPGNVTDYCIYFGADAALAN